MPDFAGRSHPRLLQTHGTPDTRKLRLQYAEVILKSEIIHVEQNKHRESYGHTHDSPCKGKPSDSHPSLLIFGTPDQQNPVQPLKNHQYGGENVEHGKQRQHDTDARDKTEFRESPESSKNQNKQG